MSLPEFEANYARQKFNIWHVTDFIGTPLVTNLWLFSVTGESQQNLPFPASPLLCFFVKSSIQKLEWVYWTKHVWQHFSQRWNSSKKSKTSTFAFLTLLWLQEHKEHRRSCSYNQQHGFWWQRLPCGLSRLAPGPLVADYSSTFLDGIFSRYPVPWAWFSLFLIIRPSLNAPDSPEALGLCGRMVSLWLCHLPTRGFVPTAAPAARPPAKNSAPLAGVISKLPPKENRQWKPQHCWGSLRKPGAQIKSMRLLGCQQGALKALSPFCPCIYLRASVCSKCRSAHQEIHGETEDKMTVGLMNLQKLSFP